MNKPFTITTLVFIANAKGDQLLLQRRNKPNQGLWSPIGGKLDTSTGESPMECAIRESREEAGLHLSERDLHPFSYVSERDYEGSGHWLMFLFAVAPPVEVLPPAHPEGNFAFHNPRDFDSIPLPESDRRFLWPLYFDNPSGFTALRLFPTGPGPEAPLKCLMEASIRPGKQ